jgi:Tfp pilus assembly protein PilO
MKRKRHKAFIRLLQRAAVGMVVLDVVVYFAAVRALRARRAQAESSYHRVMEESQQRQERVARLAKFQEQLPQSDEQLKTFLSDHVPTRRHAFSEAIRMIRVITTQSKVQLDNVSYKLTPEKDEPLERLRVDVAVEGPFMNLLQFAHTLESAPQLILLKDFTFSTSQGSIVSLKVGAELYLTP